MFIMLVLGFWPLVTQTSGGFRFNFPGEKYPLFTASEQEFQKIKLPASHRVRRHLRKCQHFGLTNNVSVWK